MTFSIDEFRKYLAIDKTSLDEAVIHQPELLYQVSEAMIIAISRRDSLKEELSTADSEVEIDIREVFDKKGTKVTEAAIKALVQTDKIHIDAFKAYLSSKEEADKIIALKEAFQQRGYMLRDLCQLFVANFFESGSLRGTNAIDQTVYQERRKLIGEERAKRKA